MEKEEKIWPTNNKNKINNTFIKTSNSYIRGSLAQKFLLKIIKIRKKIKKAENKPKNLLNRNAKRRHKAILSDLSTNNLTRINIKSYEKRKSAKSSNNKNHNEKLFIDSACKI